MLNCLIVDDEPLARRQIESYVSRIPFLKLVGSVRNTAAAMQVLHSDPVDLIFLDIKMPGITGIDFLKNNDVFQQVIFITAFPEYAIEGFELEVTDYLMKPVTFGRFLKACEKAFDRVGGSDTIRSIQARPGFLYVKCNQRFQKILVNDILFIEAMLNYVTIVTTSGKYIVYSSLKAIWGSLPPQQFIRIHKSYLAGVAHITAISSGHVHIREHALPVSRANKQAVVKMALTLST
ncbi:response regulator transcription factor [Mucilaginibacter sp. 14171R-50]|uniref:LytR/AlgR family response regulator transcription factor n=1 Tax=Mucilaginibacter sp. 14171R-50 TaxID=2703789 RepID=UPI00138C561F|nr:LytTR family DNA-binding domain-containing protein [Mucilaginibacter sp. 14171R-50]QHS57449.1 response regulator transcription factor [Mucilaginibacter sp. 14171R-50]